MTSWLVAVTAGRWQRNGIRQARALGFNVVAIDADVHAEGFTEANHIVNLPLNDVDGIIKELKAMNADIRGVVSFASDAGVPLAAAIREHFGLPGAPPEVCCRLVNKAVQRRLWQEQKLPGPRFQIIETPEAALETIAEFGFPLIVKPSDSSGSRGVTKLESPFDDISGAVTRAFRFSRSCQILIEEYMEGTEFTVESFSANGQYNVLAVTQKKKVKATRGTVAQELCTPQCSPEILDRITSLTASAYRALGYEEGPGHAEVILMDDGSLGLVEVAGRGGGFMVFDRLVPAMSGIDIADLTVIQAVGMEVGEVVPKRRAAVLRFLPSRPGKLVAIHGIEEANRIDGVEAGAIGALGDTFGKAATDGDRMGWILSQGETLEIAQQLANRAEALLTFELVS